MPKFTQNVLYEVTESHRFNRAVRLLAKHNDISLREVSKEMGFKSTNLFQKSSRVGETQVLLICNFFKINFKDFQHLVSDYNYIYEIPTRDTNIFFDPIPVLYLVYKINLKTRNRVFLNDLGKFILDYRSAQTFTFEEVEKVLERIPECKYTLR